MTHKTFVRVVEVFHPSKTPVTLLTPAGNPAPESDRQIFVNETLAVTYSTGTNLEKLNKILGFLDALNHIYGPENVAVHFHFSVITALPPALPQS